MKTFLTTAFSILLMSSASVAHEGHHEPTGLEAPHGGMIKPGKLVNLELVQEGTTIKLFPVAHAGEKAPTDLKLTAKATTPKKGKGKGETQTLSLKPDGEGYSATVDTKGAHRFELEVQVTSSGKADKFVFQVEPQG